MINEAVEYQNLHVIMFGKYRCYTSFAHVNTQRLPSSFDEFSLMMNRYQFYIVALSKTWLKDAIRISTNQWLLISMEKKRVQKWRRSFYIKGHMHFKICHDLGKTDESIEIWCIELRSRNKNLPFLTGVVYQPSSNESKS